MNSKAVIAPEWVAKKEGARMLGVSLRQIERHVSAGRLRSRTEPRKPHEKTAPVVVARADLDALRAGRPNYHPVVERGELPAKPVRLLGDSQPNHVNHAGAADLLLRHLSAAPALPSWLSIPEASKEMRLPAWFLRRRAPELVRFGVALNVGRGNKPRWRLLRSQITGVLLVGATGLIAPAGG